MPAATAIMLVGSLVSAVSQYQAGQAQKDAYKANARMAAQEAEAIDVSTNYKVQKEKEKARALSARQRVLYAKAGVDLSSGSPLLVMAEDAGRMEEDIYMTQYAGDVQALKARNQASMYRWSGNQAAKAGTTNAFSTLVQGLGSAGMAAYKGGSMTQNGQQGMSMADFPRGGA